ncbi:MAG: DUF4070 domain-containing protein [Candidatus Nealsonbacteria bacterium]
MKILKVLFIYPKYPDTFWSFKYALKFISRKAAFPPLGLLTIAAMIPQEWVKKLIDMNVSALEDQDIKWADCVFISAMITQKESAKEVIRRCNQFGTKVVAGGPVFTTGYKEFKGVDHFVLGEAETTLPQFLADFQKGCAKQVYASNDRPDITRTPIPLWSLINTNKYVSMCVQYSRGCPYDCEFCDIIIMNGRVPRTKNQEQLLRELEAVYQTGFHGSLFIVDDNFIGNKTKVKQILPAIIQWQKERKYPFWILTESSLDLADDKELMRMMTTAGFDMVFIGLETPNEKSLEECNKFRNKGKDMVSLVKEIQNHGLQVMGGYIVGFDNDPLTIFQDQINFIQKTGVVVAMVGILTALPGTKLFKRLEGEGRLPTVASGDNTDASINFIPKMNAEVLSEGYRKIIQTIYSPKNYYERIITFFEEYRPTKQRSRASSNDIKALLKSIWHIGILGRWNERWYYWKLVLVTCYKYRQFFSSAIVFSIYGFHFRKIAEHQKN